MVVAAGSAAYADEKKLLDMAQRYYVGGDYYSTITEVMRYQCLYPDGVEYSRSMLLMGKAYYKGNNIQAAMNIFLSCFKGYTGKIEGEEALYLAGFIQLMKGTPHEALKVYDTYRATYASGKYTEELDRDTCYSAALSSEFSSSIKNIWRYRAHYPQGKFLKDIDRLEYLVSEHTGRTRRYMWVSVLGSIFIPGFGQFYTGNYAVGVLTFITNALCAFMIYNGYRLHDPFQMVFFSLAGAAVYQYNIFSSVRVVKDYNEKIDRDFFKKVKLGISSSF
jgi:outer membrane protein assembly factor BamD (BamD/ComL family)